MKIISFGWTSSALVSGEKSVTRRNWKQSYAESFSVGEMLQAWNRLPRTKGEPKPRKIGEIELLAAPALEWSNTVPTEDWVREGFAYLETSGVQVLGHESAREIWERWHADPHQLYVVRFKFYPLKGMTGRHGTHYDTMDPAPVAREGAVKGQWTHPSMSCDDPARCDCECPHCTSTWQRAGMPGARFDYGGER